jgi:hypothetical protein
MKKDDTLGRYRNRYRMLKVRMPTLRLIWMKDRWERWQIYEARATIRGKPHRFKTHTDHYDIARHRAHMWRQSVEWEYLVKRKAVWRAKVTKKPRNKWLPDEPVTKVVTLKLRLPPRGRLAVQRG